MDKTRPVIGEEQGILHFRSWVMRKDAMPRPDGSSLRSIVKIDGLGDGDVQARYLMIVSFPLRMMAGGLWLFFWVGTCEYYDDSDAH